MAIYTKYTGSPWQSDSSTLIIGTAIGTGTQSFEFTNNSILENLKDNDEAYILPKYLRDMFISTWDSTVFKTTTTSGSSKEYIGIDSGLGDNLLEKPNRDLEINKIFLGKRSYSGTYSYDESYDIMTSNLLSSDVDIFLYNTRSDNNITQQSTRMIILAGSDETKHPNSPYIQSQVTTIPGGSQSLTLDILNRSGDISILSQGIDYFGNNISSGGKILINNIVFPSIGTSSQIPIDNNNLIYRDGEFAWEKIEFPPTDHIGITGSLVNIFGSPVVSNSHSLEFNDSRPSPINLGDLSIGETFNNMSMADVLRKIIYPYLPPICTISLANNSGYVEVGTYPNINVNYSITKRTNNTLPTKLINMIPGTYPKIVSSGQTTVSGVARGVMIEPVTATTSTFTIKVNDGTASNSASVQVSGIYPYFYGFTSSNTLTVAVLSSMTKIVEYKGNKTYDLTGSGNFFFAYDSAYGPLTLIKDDLENNIFASFSVSTKMLSSPTGLWTSKEYLVYKWSDVAQIGPPSKNFDFEY